MILSIRIVRGVGKRLRAERVRLGLTQEQLGNKVGVTKVTIFAYEHETSHLTVPMLVKLASHGFNLSFLLEGDKPRSHEESHMPHLIKRLAGGLARRRKQILADPSYDDQSKVEALLTGFALASDVDGEQSGERVAAKKTGHRY